MIRRSPPASPHCRMSAASSRGAHRSGTVLAEAQQQFRDDATPIRLGPVGGRIVMETFAGILLGDSHSFLSQDPTWTPVKPDFKMADLIKMATSV